MKRYFIVNHALSIMVCLSIVLLSPVGVFASSQAKITIEPSSAEAGAAIKIIGRGFKPGEEVDVLFVLEENMKIGLGTTKVDVITADDKGGFNVEAGIPVNAKPGKYTIEAIGNKDSMTTTTVEVTPKKK